jgi:hypothetical protein
VDGQTPLHLAIMHKNIDMAAALVRKGGNMQIKNGEGKTPLDLIENPMDVQKVCMVANIAASMRNPLLPEPKDKIRDCT